MPSSSLTAGEVLGVDIGGTFTDFVLIRDGKLTVHKAPSDPSDPARPLLDGVEGLRLSPSGEVVHGSTVATNALLERKGARTALVTTRGFADVLEIGRQDRPRLHDFHQTRPPPLVPRELRLELAERLDASGKVLLSMDPRELEEVASRLARMGAESVAVSLLFSFLNPAHERRVEEALRARSLPFVSLSSEVAPEPREYERTSTAVLSAYVTPVVARYLDRLEEGLGGRRLRIIQSNGGSISGAAARRSAARTAFSGPAAGVVGACAIARLAGHRDIITLDVGGTSTDVALCRGGPRETTEGSVAGFPLRLPTLDIHSIGAGGGSIARVDAGGALRVGPESAGARPGPACYGLGGKEATLTDAHLVLRRLAPEGLLGGRMPLVDTLARRAIGALATSLGCGLEEAAAGIAGVACAAMERALRRISVERGLDPRDFTLVAFGGAGPLHACALAGALGIRRVLVPRHPGVLSALGMLATGNVKDYSRGVLKPLAAGDDAGVEAIFESLLARARAEMAADGDALEDVSFQPSMDLRYAGQSYEINVPHDRVPSTLERFHALHLERHGHSDPSLQVELVVVRVRAAGPVPDLRIEASPALRAPACFDGGCLGREGLVPGDRLRGPCAVHQFDATTWIEDGWEATVDARSNLIIEERAP